MSQKSQVSATHMSRKLSFYNEMEITSWMSSSEIVLEQSTACSTITPGGSRRRFGGGGTPQNACTRRELMVIDKTCVFKS